MFLIILTLTACGVTKRLPEGGFLLHDNELTVNYPDTLKRSLQIHRSTIKEYIPVNQIPNSNLFGYNLALRIYQLANPESDSWGNEVLRKIGKAPIMYDSVANEMARRNLKLYMESEGFYNSIVTDSVTYKGRKATVHYHINAGAPYYISSYSYNFADSTVMPYVLYESSSSLIDKGMILKRSLLTEERLRLTNELQDDGFYHFTVSSIDYQVDTMGSTADVTININQRVVDRARVDHRRYRLGNINVRPTSTSYSYLNSRGATITNYVIDSITYNYPSSINAVKPKFLSELITITPNQLYSKSEIMESRNRINTIPLYRNVVMSLNERADSVEFQEYGILDCDIQTVQNLQHDFNVELELSTSANFSGFSLAFGYSNKNIFRGGETLNLSANAGYDFITRGESEDSWELGGSVSLLLPRLLSPFGWNSLRSLNNISTEIEAIFLSQRRPDYDRTTSTIAFGYNWNSRKWAYSYRPVSFSLIDVPRIDPTFFDRINSSLGGSTNPFLLESYESQIVAGSTFSIIYNNQSKEYNKIIVRGNLETSGNLLYLASDIFKAELDTDATSGYKYKLFGVPYSQFIRGDLIFNYSTKLSSNLELAYRLWGAYGRSYGNASVMPSSKRYYAGGGNSMRGWQIRALGPGSADESSDVYNDYRLGDIKLETNLELRFPIYDILKGALFFDLGNIWDSYGKEDGKVGGFDINSFYNELGFNTGLGFRLDFDFFVIRLDWGVQVLDPNRPIGERWVIKDFSLDNTAIHVGIGYPF